MYWLTQQVHKILEAKLHKSKFGDVELKSYTKTAYVLKESHSIVEVGDDFVQDEDQQKKIWSLQESTMEATIMNETEEDSRSISGKNDNILDSDPGVSDPDDSDPDVSDLV